MLLPGLFPSSFLLPNCSQQFYSLSQDSLLHCFSGFQGVSRGLPREGGEVRPLCNILIADTAAFPQRGLVDPKKLAIRQNLGDSGLPLTCPTEALLVLEMCKQRKGPQRPPVGCLAQPDEHVFLSECLLWTRSELGIWQRGWAGPCPPGARSLVGRHTQDRTVPPALGSVRRNASHLLI